MIENNANKAIDWLEGFVELMGCNVEPAKTHIATLRTAISLLEINKNEHSHECRKCNFRYTPSSSNEDCPACGFDGIFS